MKRSRHVTMRLFPVVACLFAAMLASLLTSCGFNLDPSWSAARTSVSVTLAGAIPSAGNTGAGAGDQGRAISTSSGFLYLQTGLTAETAKVYGPYSVSAGAAVTVTDIPAGTYPGMILFFVPTELLESFDPLFPGELTTDSARGAAQACLAGDPSALYSASIALIPNVDIKEGAKNQVGATLVPITDSTPDGDGNLSVEGSSGYVTRRFIRLDDVAAAFTTIPAMSAGARTAGSMGAVIKNMTLNLRNLDETGSLTVSAVGLYDSTGKRIYRSDESINLAAYAEQSLYSVPWSGDNVYYAYVEFTGRGISCHFAESIVDLSTQALVTLDWNAPGYTTQTLETYGAGTMVYLPLCPATYSGHVFKGWAKTANATTPEYPKDSECSFPAGAITLYAVWEVDLTSYTVTYDLQGGSGVFPSQSGTTGTIINLSSDEPTKPGFEFLGWSLYFDGTSVDYAKGTQFTINLNDVTLYALWSDTVAPTLSSPLVCNGAEFTASTSGATITATCYEVGSGIKRIYLGTDAVYDANNEPVFYLNGSPQSATYDGAQMEYVLQDPVLASGVVLRVENVTLFNVDGSRTVSLKVRDATGNESAVVSDAVTLDTVIPSAYSLQIYDLDTNAMNRNSYTNSENVILMLTCGDSVSGISSIRLTGLANLPHVSGVPSFSVTYNGSSQTVLSFDTTTITLVTPVVGEDKTMLIHGVSLPSPDEPKDVTVILVDLAGNESLVQYSSTTLDRLPPEINAENPNADHVSATVTEVNPNASDYTVYYTKSVFSSAQTIGTIMWDGEDATWDYSGTGVVSGITTLSQPGSGSLYSYVKLIASDMAGNTTTRYVERKVTNTGDYSVTLY
jgi:Listeria-Bacteroides repeat domain (List_Bact_rpt)